MKITEGAAINNPESCIEIFSKHRFRGIGLALDDFGTGHFVPNVAIPIHVNHHYLRCKREQSHVSNAGHRLVLVTTGINDAPAWRLPVDAGDRRS